MTMKSKIPAGVRFDGEVLGDGDLLVAGRVQGEVRIGGALTVEVGAQVNGDVHARTVTVSGAVVGDVTASESVRVNPGARLVGDIEAQRVNIVQGAKFRGNIRMPRVRAVEWQERAISTEMSTDAPTVNEGDTLTPPAGMAALAMATSPLVNQTPTRPGTVKAETAVAPEAPASPLAAKVAPTAAEPVEGQDSPRRVRNRDTEARPRRTRRARRAPPSPVMPSVGRMTGRRRDVTTE